MSLLDLGSLLVLVDPQGSDALEAFLSSQNVLCRRFGRARDALTNDDCNSSEVDLSAHVFDPNAVVPVHLALSFNPGPMEVSKGSVFGSDPETCDVVIAKDKYSGVSSNHFSISVDWQTGNPLITCLTPNEGSTGIRILSDSRWVLYLGSAWRVVDPGIPTSIKISEEMIFVVHNPGRANQEPAYSANLQSYFKKCQEAVPEMAHLTLYDSEPTPLLISRGRGMTGIEYFTTKAIVGKKVVFRMAKSHQSPVGDSQSFIIKHFRYVDKEWPDHAKATHNRARRYYQRYHRYMPVYLPEPPETLADRQIREPLTEMDAGAVLAQVFEGLKFLHGHWIVHGGLYPGNIRIKHSCPRSIRLSDIALHPYVELEDSKERRLYESQPQPGHNTPVYVQDTWSAGVVGLSLLSPGGLPPRPVDKQHAWTRSLVNEAIAFHAAERPGPAGKMDAARFLTSVLKYAYLERLTAEECLQDPWIQLWRLPLPYDREDSQDLNDPFFYVPGSAGQPGALSGTGSAPEEAEDGDESGEETEIEEPRTSISKGKQLQPSRHTSVALSSDPYQQRSAAPQIRRYPGGTLTGSHHTSVEPSSSVSRQASVAFPESTNPVEHTQALRHASVEPSSTVSSNHASDESTQDVRPSIPFSRQSHMDPAETYLYPGAIFTAVNNNPEGARDDRGRNVLFSGSPAGIEGGIATADANLNSTAIRGEAARGRFARLLPKAGEAAPGGSTPEWQQGAATRGYKIGATPVYMQGNEAMFGSFPVKKGTSPAYMQGNEATFSCFKVKKEIANHVMR